MSRKFNPFSNSKPPGGSSIPSSRLSPRPPQREGNESFQEFSASVIYCPKCKKAMPVRNKLLLYIPGGEVSDYVCTDCGTAVGKKTSN